MILAILNLQVPTKFQVNWPLGSREEVQYKLSGWWLWQPSWKNKSVADGHTDRQTDDVKTVYPTTNNVCGVWGGGGKGGVGG